jgi:hypothetical protein
LERDVIDIGFFFTSAHKVELFAMSRMVQKPQTAIVNMLGTMLLASWTEDWRVQSTFQNGE